MKVENNIFSYVRQQEKMYELPIRMNNSWDWSMKKHIDTTVLYNNSELLTTKDDFTPVKNITRPILNLQHRTEDIELKDVQIYVNDSEKYHLSFLVKKYHDDVFVKENDLDTFFDELNVSRIDFGAGLSKRTEKGREVVPLQSIAFCDQTDILSGPIGIKHYYSPDQLLDMKSAGWGESSNGATATIEQLIELSRDEKRDDHNGTITQTPGRYIEVFEVHGNLPKHFAEPHDTSGKYETRLFIVAFYQGKNQKEEGIILYTGIEKENPFMLIKRDPVYGRALGFGGAEELFEPQVWINYDEKRILDMKDAASKTILLTNDPVLAKKQKIKDMDNLELVSEAVGGNTRQLDTYPRNLALFEKSIAQWEAHAQQMGAANDSIMGQPPTAGTPFKLQELVTAESHGLHDYRRGQFAKHIEDIYNKDFIPKIAKAITNGAEFLSELSMEEMQYVTEAMSVNAWNEYYSHKVLDQGTFAENEQEIWIQQWKDEFKKKGNKHFIEILKGEFAKVPLGVKVTVAGKSKNLSQQVDKMSNMVRFIFSTYSPQTGTFAALDDPRIAKMMNDVWESSGFSPVDFSNAPKKPVMPIQQNQPVPSPMQIKQPIMA